MNTRSKTIQSRNKVDIDFDEASRAWRANKKAIKNGCFIYLCRQKTLSVKRERLINDIYCITLTHKYSCA